MAGTGKKRGSKGEPTPDGDRFMDDTPTCDTKAALKVEWGSGGNAKAVPVLLACLWRRDSRSGLASSGLWTRRSARHVAAQHTVNVHQDVAAARYLNMPRAAATHS